jgi:hypothetical protein
VILGEEMLILVAGCARLLLSTRQRGSSGPIESVVGGLFARVSPSAGTRARGRGYRPTCWFGWAGCTICIQVMYRDIVILYIYIGIEQLHSFEMRSDLLTNRLVYSNEHEYFITLPLVHLSYMLQCQTLRKTS